MQVVFGATYFFMPSLPKRVQRYKLYFELHNFGETFCKVFLWLVMQAVLRCGEIVMWYRICPKRFCIPYTIALSLKHIES